MQGVCYYIGRFSPPTSQHLETALYLTRRENINEVIIILGKDEPNEIDQDDKYDIWRMLLSSGFATNINIERSKDASSSMHLYNKLSKYPNTEAFIAMDEKSARNKSFINYFDKFKNIQIELIPSQYETSSKNMMKAVANDDLDTLKRFIPDTFSDDDIDSLIQILKPDAEAPDESSEQLKERVIQSFGKDFWKMSLAI